MRRKEREIREIKDLLDIIEKCKNCRLGLCDDNQPYIVPLNYGYAYRDSVLTLYFHSAKEGKKMDIIKRNNKACF
jgi:nitroimidazol reductase NimA-like FMN-containing flavoprotein (pyridoxamine 5'-phosphate oxidase superfamily)